MAAAASRARRAGVPARGTPFSTPANPPSKLQASIGTDDHRQPLPHRGPTSRFSAARCIKHGHLLAYAPGRPREEIAADDEDMIHAGTKPEIATKRKAFIREWRRKCRAIADSREEAGDELFTVTRFPQSQWKSLRASHEIERPHEEFKRRIKTETVLSPERAEGGGNRGDVVLGFAGFWPDHDAQGRRLAKPRRKALRSDD